MATRRTAVPPAPLNADLLTLMISSPWAVGKTLLTAPTHDALRAVWRDHEATIRTEAARRGCETIWYLEREWFVRALRGEEP
jgi:hypothetical protein